MKTSTFPFRLLFMSTIITIILFNGYAFSGEPSLPPNTKLLSMVLDGYSYKITPNTSKFTNAEVLAVWDPRASGIKDFEDDGKHSTEIVTSKIIKTEKGTFLLAATATYDENRACHAYAPTIGCSIYKWDGSGWKKEQNVINLTRSGSFGHYPEMKFIQAGPEQWGLGMDWYWQGQGIQEGGFIFYLVSEKFLKVVFKTQTHYDEFMPVADHKTTTKLETEISFDKCTSCEFYDIIVKSKLTDLKIGKDHEWIQPGVTRYETKKYRFKDGAYSQTH